MDHIFANDGTDWKTKPSPVDADKARAADAKLDKTAAQGDGPSANNEVRLASTIVAGSTSK